MIKDIHSMTNSESARSIKGWYIDSISRNQDQQHYVRELKNMWVYGENRNEGKYRHVCIHNKFLLWYTVTKKFSQTFTCNIQANGQNNGWSQKSSYHKINYITCSVLLVPNELRMFVFVAGMLQCFLGGWDDISDCKALQDKMDEPYWWNIYFVRSYFINISLGFAPKPFDWRT